MRLLSYRVLARTMVITALAGTFTGTALAVTSLPEPGGEVKEQLQQPGAEVESNLPKPPPETTETKFTVKSVDLMAPELKLPSQVEMSLR